ncbi:MAG: hypothetical protein HY978_03125 [Candidatus Liptonbacteria bacterium]|nr:hypothetical protein [Candidatus Liptonbacteria bacterium]
MPLPQTVSDKLRERQDAGPGWSGELLMFSGAIFLMGVFVYFGVVYGLDPYLTRKVASLDAEIQALSQEVPLEDQVRTIGLFSQINNLRTVLDKHTVASPVFAWLEVHTLPQVFFTRLTLNARNRQLVLSGVARTIPDLSAQVAVLEKQSDDVEQLSVGNITIHSSGVWQFDLNLRLSPKLFALSPLLPASGSAAATSTPRSSATLSTDLGQATGTPSLTTSSRPTTR